METTQNVRATRGQRVRTQEVTKTWWGGRQKVTTTSDTFACTDGTQVVRRTEYLQYESRSRRGKYHPLYDMHKITWYTLNGARGFDGTMEQACHLARIGR